MVELMSCQSREQPSLRAAGARNLPDRVVVINDVSTVRGGATGVAMASIELLRRLGIPVTFITGDDGAGSGFDGVDILAVGGKHILSGSRFGAMIGGLYNRNAARLLAQWIRTQDTPRTIYHLHGWSKILSPSVFHALRPVSSRLVVAAHDFFLVCPNGGYFDFRSERPCTLKPMTPACLLSACDRRNYAHKLWRSARQGVRRAFIDLGRDAAAVVAVHEGMLPLLELGGIAQRRLRVLRNPVTPWQEARVVAELNRHFLFVGRLEQDKGPDLFAAAAHQAGVPMRIIGAGPLQTGLAESYPTAEILGWIPKEELVGRIGDARALVIPTRSRESFGLVAMEALGSGIPIVISEYAMIADEIARAGIGFVCNPHDRNAFASVLMRMARDDRLLASMSRRAYAGAPRLAPSPASWCEELLGIYADVLRDVSVPGRPTP